MAVDRLLESMIKCLARAFEETLGQAGIFLKIALHEQQQTQRWD